MADLNEMNADDYESTLGLLSDLRDLIRAEHLSVEDRLSAIDHAITEAIGGIPEQARDFVQGVILGTITP